MTAPTHEKCARCHERSENVKVVRGSSYGFWDGRTLCEKCKRFRDKLHEEMRQEKQRQREPRKR